MSLLTDPIFLQALVMILREGLESILIFSALCLYVVKLGAPERLPVLYGGAGAALAASVGTGWAAITFWHASELHAGAEGVLMLLAAALMFYVSGWLYYRQDPAIWTKYLKNAVGKALATEKVWPLGLLAFLAIYREGLETVQFLLALSSQTGGWGTSILSALGIGALVLAAVYLAIRKLALRLPLRPVFLATSALLFAMGLHFVMEGIHEMQEVAWLTMTDLGLGDELTLEAIIPTLALIASATAGILWLRGKGKRGL
jgi:high-affinity iron transporter